MQHNSYDDRDIEPWYRQFWPWMIISIPLLTVIGGIITIVLAVRSPNAMVVDDYYKEGLAINQQKARLQQARELGIYAMLRSDETSLRLQLQHEQEITEPDSLYLQVIHATLAGMDRKIALMRVAPGQYEASWSDLPEGRWNFQLHPADESWALRSFNNPLAGAFQLQLLPEE
jgi:hypothetical protein